MPLGAGFTLLPLRTATGRVAVAVFVLPSGYVAVSRTRAK